MAMTPGVPSNEYIIYELIYKKGGPAQKIHFRAESLENAILVGKEYCTANNLFFVFVNPWEVNLKELLKKKEEFNKAG